MGNYAIMPLTWDGLVVFLLNSQMSDLKIEYHVRIDKNFFKDPGLTVEWSQGAIGLIEKYCMVQIKKSEHAY